MYVPAGDRRETLLRDPAEHLVAVEELVTVDERAEGLGLPCDPPCRAHRREVAGRVRVRGHHRRAKVVGRLERVDDPRIDRDMLLEAECERMRGEVWVVAVVGQLETGNH